MTNTNKNTTIHQGHGDHMAPFFKDDEILIYINDIIQSSKPGNDIETEYVSYESDEKIKAEVLAMRYESGSIGFLTLLAKPQHQQQYEYISGYPYLDGIAHDVVITDVFEWKNCLEATVKCMVRNEYDEDFEFSFFATDYYANKHRYQVGAKLRINLAASALSSEQGSLGFEFTGQQAVDFLAKTGRQPTYDDKGNIEPVKFSTAELVAFMPTDDETPDIVGFMSPIKVINTDMVFFDKKISRGEILIHRDPDIKTTLYYNAETKIEAGYPIMGGLWLSAHLEE